MLNRIIDFVTNNLQSIFATNPSIKINSKENYTENCHFQQIMI